MALDFEKIFENFSKNNESSAIRDIYGIIPELSDEALQVIDSLYCYIYKYDLQDLDKFLRGYMERKRRNKNLGFMKNMTVKNLLKAYTQEELIRGIKVQSRAGNGEEK